MEHNSVKSPKHYTEGRNFEPKDVIRDWRLNFNLGSALKYIARAGRKGDIIEDLEKAKEYLSFEIEAIKAEKAATTHSEGKHFKKEPEKMPNVQCGVIELKVPKGMPLNEIIQLAIKKVQEEIE